MDLHWQYDYRTFKIEMIDRCDCCHTLVQRCIPKELFYKDGKLYCLTCYEKQKIIDKVARTGFVNKE